MPFYEDLQVGDVHRSRIGRTISETDNTWFTLLTGNTNQVHFNEEFAKGPRFGRILVNSCLTLSIVVGPSVADTSENAVANLSWESGVRTRGINQRREVVCEYRRSFMVPRRDAPEAADGFPGTEEAWRA
jgi:acyl dehydratase